MLGFFKAKSADADIANVRRALSPRAVAVLSASCCMPGTAEVDAQAESAARAALASAQLDWPLLRVTVTQAQSVLPQVSGELDSAQRALADQITGLFLSHGLGVFPIVLAHQRLVSYGGAPQAALILNALPRAPAAPPTEARHAHIA